MVTRERNVEENGQKVTNNRETVCGYGICKSTQNECE